MILVPSGDSRHHGSVADTLERIRKHGVVAVVDAPVEDRLLDWAKAVGRGGVKILGVPVTVDNVTELVDDLADEADLMVGVTDVTSPDQVSLALAAGAELVLSPIAEPAVIGACRERGLFVIAGAATPTEVTRALEAGADLVAVHPVGAMGGVRYFETLMRQFRGATLLASGAIDVENAPGLLEAGALGVIVDRGVFPEPNEPAALEVITARALALIEVCTDAMGSAERQSMTDILSASAAPPAGGEPAAEPSSAEGGLSELLEPEEDEDPLAEGSQPLRAEDVLGGGDGEDGELEMFDDPLERE